MSNGVVLFFALFALGIALLFVVDGCITVARDVRAFIEETKENGVE